MSDISRRLLVQSGLMSLLASPALLASNSAGKPDRVNEVEVTLEGRAPNLGRELVNFGLPLTPGFLSDSRLVRVVTANREEISAAVRSLEPWRIGGKEGSI